MLHAGVDRARYQAQLAFKNLILDEFRGVMDDNAPSPPGFQAQWALHVLIVEEILGVMDDHSLIRD